MKRAFILCLSWFLLQELGAQERQLQTDVLVIGAGTGGTAAALQSARMGVKTILIDPGQWLGGMLTAAGVSCTDGNDQLPSGIWEAFRQALYQHYGRKKLNSGWVSNTCFEPSVGDSIFRSWVLKEKNLEWLTGYTQIEVIQQKNRIKGAVFRQKDGKDIIRIHAMRIIDATELGDLMALSGTAYDLGMDEPKESGESQAREKNNIIQDLTWAAVLKDYGPGTDHTIPRPASYDSTLYYCCCTDAPCNSTPWNGDKFKMLNYGKLPRSPGARQDKYMLNWPPHGNDIYLNLVEDDEATRERKYDSARQHTLGFIYFIQTQLGMKNIGLADDELNGGMAWIPYHREGRRLKGKLRMNLSHILRPYDHTWYRTGIAVGDYPVDHHHASYPGKVPELEFPSIPAFNIPLGALIPADKEGLILCEKGISVSNIVNGCTRLQPVVLLTGQAAGVLAALSVKQQLSPAAVSIRSVQEELIAAGAYIMPFTDVKRDDPHWAAIQRTGATGILKGVGKAEGWANKMFFYPDTLADPLEVSIGFRGMGYVIVPNNRRFPRYFNPTIDGLFKFLRLFRPFIFKPVFAACKDIESFREIWSHAGLGNFHPDRKITRRELAVILDQCTSLFNNKNLPLSTEGKYQFRYSTF